MISEVPYREPAIVAANGIEICYDAFGDPAAPPLLLVIGLGQQMIAWDEEMCRQLAARGYWVIRYDNRETGMSTKFDQASVPNIAGLFEALAEGIPIDSVYSILDMADDAVGLLDALSLESAHVVGESMGGMIGQRMAIHRSDRIRTLTSIMSSTGDPGLPPPTAEASEVLANRPPTDRAGYVADYVDRWRVLHGPDIPYDEEASRKLAERIFDRGLYPPGFARQLAAIFADGSRKEALGSVTVPTLVIHGKADPLVPVECGIATAEAVPGAKLVLIDGMGHTFPAEVWPQVIDAIAAHAV